MKRIILLVAITLIAAPVLADENPKSPTRQMLELRLENLQLKAEVKELKARIEKLETKDAPKSKSKPTADKFASQRKKLVARLDVKITDAQKELRQYQYDRKRGKYNIQPGGRGKPNPRLVRKAPDKTPSLKKKITSLQVERKTLANHRHPLPFYEPLTLDGHGEVKGLKVVQVQDSKNMLAYIPVKGTKPSSAPSSGYSGQFGTFKAGLMDFRGLGSMGNPHDVLVWITNYPTRGLVDNTTVTPNKTFRVTGTKTYKASNNASKTVFVIEPI